EDGKINVVDIVKGYRPFEVKFESRPFSYNHLYENLAAKSYYIQIKDSLGCVIDTTIIVEPATFINATLTGDTLIYLGQEANLFADYNLSSGEVMDFEWYPDSLKCHPCDERQVYPFRNTYYSYVVKSVDGCLDSAQLLVRVIQDPRLDFPNIFSPNGDGVNDVIVFPPFPSVEYVYDFKIFSNWGALIFDVQNFDPSVDNIVWDGRFNGAVLNPGVFVYMMKVRLKNGKEIIHTGDITLIR
ncbi:MAG: gliding motility-associated C-terminal domain-containing protein, partial [Saprospiraceae bacterium]|nr:gliding motility-associated C-terminal domain-containing protein [Saprospiraceae bacterium]